VVNILINRCIFFMIQARAVPDTEEQREVYAYGLELIIHYFINAAILLAIGLLFGRLTETAALLLLFGTVQANGGGYHAETHGRCLALMVLGVLLFLALLPLYQAYAVIQPISVIAGLTAVICLTPVAHRNHPLSPQKSLQMGKRAKVTAGGISFLWCFIYFYGAMPTAAAVIAISMFYLSISMLAAWVKYRKEKNNEIYNSN